VSDFVIARREEKERTFRDVSRVYFSHKCAISVSFHLLHLSLSLSLSLSLLLSLLFSFLVYFDSASGGIGASALIAAPLMQCRSSEPSARPFY